MMGFVNPLSVAKLRHEGASPVVVDLGDCGKEPRRLRIGYVSCLVLFVVRGLREAVFSSCMPFLAGGVERSGRDSSILVGRMRIRRRDQRGKEGYNG